MPSNDWQRRNDRARSLGYRNYYDYRIHDYGRLPAWEPPPSGEERDRLRGHTGLRDAIRKLPHAVSVTVQGLNRTSDGTYDRVGVFVTDDAGNDFFYSFDWDDDDIAELLDAITDEGIPFVLFGSGFRE